MKRLILLVFLLSHIIKSAWSLDLNFSIGIPQNHPFFKDTERIIEEIFRLVDQDITFKLTYIPYARSRQLMLEGKLDGDVGRTIYVYDQNTPAIYVSPPLMVFDFYCFWKGDFPIEGIHSLQGKVLAVDRGNIIIMRFAERNGISVEVVRSPEEALKMVSLNRADLYIGTLINMDLINGSSSEIVGLIRQDQSLFTDGAYLVLHSRHAHLAPLISRSLEKLHESGFIKKAVEPSL